MTESSTRSRPPRRTPGMGIHMILIRRHILGTLLAVAMSLALPDGTSADSDGSTRRPNIVFIMADDIGYGDLSCYGATKIRTPHVDRLARQGIRFLDAHTPSAVCSPTRYGTLTGRYAWRGRLKKWFCMPQSPLIIEPDRMTVASTLRSAGYRTACIGKWHLGIGNDGPDYTKELEPGPLEVGFDYFFGVPVSSNSPPLIYVDGHHVAKVTRPGQSTPVTMTRKFDQIATVLARKAVEFIERSKDKPFFLYLVPCNVHNPLTPNARFRGTSQAGLYGDFVREFDWMVGRVTETLDRLGLTDNTLLIVTSDNGAVRFAEKFGHHSCGTLRGQKSDIWEGGHRVPFIARWPGKIKPDSTSDEVICMIDLMATVAGIVGVRLPADAGEDSYDILPALLGRKLDRPIREATVLHSGAGMFAIRQGRWKLILGRGSGGVSPPRWFKPKPNEPQGQLYDLRDDPREQRNLWTTRPDVVERLAKLLEKYKKTGRSRW